MCCTPCAQPTPEEKLEELTIGAKYVYRVLEYEGPLTQKEITDQTLLSQRSVRTALENLEEAGLVTDHVDLRDARQRLYEVDE